MFAVIFLAALVKGIYELSRYERNRVNPLTRQRVKTYHFSEGYEDMDYEEPEPQEELELEDDLEEHDEEEPTNKWYKLFEG